MGRLYSTAGRTTPRRHDRPPRIGDNHAAEGERDRVKVAIVLNARAGAARSRLTPAQVQEFARETLTCQGAEPLILVTEGQGHARELARQAVDEGADVVCAWGGDGTVNEVASGLVYGRGVMAVVPAGSGNGFARELGVPLDKAGALAVAVHGRTRRVDVGELNGRLFVNTAGFGLDASVAHAFAVAPRGARGFPAYVRASIRHLWGFPGRRCVVRIDGREWCAGPMKMITLANTRQWGNDALIAPHARPDDGVLDLVALRDLAIGSLAVQAWRLWTGSFDRIGAVSMVTFRHAEIDADTEWPVHIDGEPAGYARRLSVVVKPQALNVRVPG
jgi:YegS/Rv2252/BmrU family lipid kinase